MKKQRGNGEGTVIKVGNRNYKAIAVVGWRDETHPIKRTKQGFRTAREARDYIPILKGERTPTRCMADYWEQIWQEVLRKGDSTQRKYSKAKDRLSPLFFADIRNIHISDLNAICADLTYNSAHAVQNLVSKVYQLAMAEQYVAVNLAPLMTLPTDHAETPKMPFAKGEIDILWGDYKQTKEPVCASILVCIYTGLMPIELLRLTKQDCDLDAGLIDSAVGAKTEKRRTSYVLVPDLVLPVLTWMCEQAQGDRLMPMTDKQYRTAFKRCMARLGLSTAHHPYDCRHTTTTLYGSALDPNTMKEVMRHTNLQMTEHYKHNKAQEMREELNKRIKKEQV